MTALNTASRSASKSNLLPISGFRDPLSLTSCAGWWDFSNAAYLSTATNGIGAVTNGSSIAYCQDRSGNGGHITQATLANRPTWSSTGINSLGAASFNGSTTSMSASASMTALHGDMTCTVFCVSTRASTSVGSQFWIGPVPYVSTAPGIALADGFQGRTRVITGASIASGTVPDLTALTATTAQVATLAKLSGPTNAFVLYRNGTLITGASNAATGASAISCSSAVMQAGFAPNLGSHSGLIGELIVYGRALSAAERLSVERYLGSKWGVTVA